MKKPRSANPRRPRPVALSPSSSTPPCSSSRKITPDGDGGTESSIKEKQLMASSKKIKKGDKASGEADTNDSSWGGHESDLKSYNQNDQVTSNEMAKNKSMKVKIKVGASTHTMRTPETGHGESSIAKCSRSSEKLMAQDDSNCRSAFPSDPGRTRKRVLKRHVLDDEAEEDGYIGCPKKPKTFKTPTDDCTETEDNRKNSVDRRKTSKVPRNSNIACDVDEDYGVSQSNKRTRKNLRQGKHSKDVHQIEEEEEPDTDDDAAEIKKKDTNGSYEVKDKHLTARQRALQSRMSSNDEPLIELLDGLTPRPSKRQKEKLSEVEIQAKKAEAAQRRKMQVEKKAKEAEDEAIRKILGQDADKKKEQKKKELDEKAEAAKLNLLGLSTVRWAIGPRGTVVTFAEDVDLPSIFNSKPYSYPPPREKCAAPSCTNAYKYRDSKTELPLCSLQCYKAVQLMNP